MDDADISDDQQKQAVTKTDQTNSPRSFRLFFFRGLGVLLPTILTLWLLVMVFNFFSEKIAYPINRGVQYLVVVASPWPKADDEDIAKLKEEFSNVNVETYAGERREWEIHVSNKIDQLGTEDWVKSESRKFDQWLLDPQRNWPSNIAGDLEKIKRAYKNNEQMQKEWQRHVADQIQTMGEAKWKSLNVKDNKKNKWLEEQPWYPREVRRKALERWWSGVRVFGFQIMDLIGLAIAVLLIYFVGLFLGSYFGRRLFKKGEDLLKRTPVFKQVYPHIKQVTDFFVGDSKEKLKFNNVVAVEYPRKGLWSLGLVTGDTMQSIQNNAGEECITVFIPSSPTPFTGYVITVPKKETIDLNISIDDALRFTVSGGVIVPESQVIGHHADPPALFGSVEPARATVSAPPDRPDGEED